MSWGGSFRTAGSDDLRTPEYHSRLNSDDGSLYLDVSDPAFESFREDIFDPDMQHAAASTTAADEPQEQQPPPPPAAPENSTSERDKERVVYIDNPLRTNEHFEFSNNKVRTSKYTLISFLPRNLFEQFHRVAYVYFLLIVILNQIPQLAVFGRLASLFPLLFVLVVTAIKDGYEDWGRHRSDRVENSRTTLVFQDGKFQAKNWKKIQAGEVVKIFENESIPCDVVLLGTSDANGVAYLQTINLDGETNLKTRYARQETASKHPSLAPITGKVVCELPNRNIYDFVAYMEVDESRVPLGPNNIILRGCVLQNTSWIVGVVVYAGKETKAMMNSSGAQSKRSRLEQHMNKETLWLSAFLLIICVVGGIGMGKWIHDHEQDLNALPYYKDREISGKKYMYYGPLGEGVFAFLSFIIMFQIMIPISLYISMELVRLGQSYFMVRDVEMFHAPSNSRLQCRALNINEDLGQIKYIFSDKTGTLTENKMEFHSASIGGVDYCDIFPKVSGTSESSDDLQSEGNQEPRFKRGLRLDPNLVDLLRSEESSENASFVHDFMLVLSACNTVVPTRQRGPLEYQAESPDEQALVMAAAAYGYTLSERTSSTIILDVLGEQQRYKVVGIHEFDSVRKRMSVVVQCPDQTYRLLLKGADTAVMAIVSKRTVLIDSTGSTISSDGKLYATTQGHLDGYSIQGLRTLVVAHKKLEQSEFEQWHERYKIASTALVDRVKLLREAAGMIETDLVLLGATGIEDKLQEGVAETIAALRNSGIKIWVLTGDKQETAISIGFSCSLLTEDMQQIVVNANTRELCVEKLKAAVQKFGLGEANTGASLPKKARSKLSKGAEVTRANQLALIIDGNSLVHALSPEVENLLYEVAEACRVVICCRVAPLQKAGIVSLMKRKTKAMTLAIGDGANDVSMIQTADVGIGLSGQEGRQAVMASDFAMGQFRFLKRLLLIHGHWNYQRLAYMVLYNLYRNAVFVMMLFWYILHTAFSAQTALFDWNLMFYSLIYTSVPTIVVGIMDKDLSQRTLLKYPPLYGVGQRGESYNSVLFWATMLDTLWQSLVLFYVPFFTFQGTDLDIWGMGCLWTASVVVLVNLHLAMDVQLWTWLTHLAIWGSIFVSFACFFVLDSLVSEGFISHFRVMFHMASKTAFWLNIFLIVAAALLPRLCAKALMQKYWPSDLHIAREAERRDRPTVGDSVAGLGRSSVELDDVLQLHKDDSSSD